MIFAVLLNIDYFNNYFINNNYFIKILIPFIAEI
jgi:hypothetical protein